MIRRSCVKFNPSLNLCLHMTEMVEYSLPMYSLSNMFAFLYINKGEVNTLSIFGFILGVTHAFLPMQLVNEKIFTLRERLPNMCTYDEVKEYFSLVTNQSVSLQLYDHSLFDNIEL